MEPTQLYVGEEGYWEMPSWGRHPDDEQWRTTGYHARTYSGHVAYRHNEEAPVLRWLAEQHYHDTGDGTHYYIGREEETR